MLCRRSPYDIKEIKMKKFTASLIFILSLAMLAGIFAGCGEKEDTRAQYTVTFNANYEGSAPSIAKVYENETVGKPADPVRAGYDFDGWYTDTALVNAYDFTSAITEDITLYASWLESGVTYYTVTYHANYAGGKDLTQKVKADSRATRPEAEHDGYELFDWYKNAECTELFSFARDKINANTGLYALWGKTYVFEAENLDFDDLEGPGYSGSAMGTSMILRDRDGAAGASGGYYVSYLYKQGITLEYNITSDKAVDNARLTLRLSAEVVNNLKINGNTYSVYINDKLIPYSDITFTGIVESGTGGGGVRPFSDHFISDSVSLKEGNNVIKLVTNNSTLMAGTMVATAPMVDCIKLSSVSELGWGEGYPIKNK